MKINPVYKREMTVSSRSFRTPLIILIFNTILAVVALLNMYSVVAQVRVTAEIRYASFLELYTFVTTMEFIMLLFIIPALTAGSISGERERQTLELMMTTKMKPSDIIIGKMAASLSTIAILIVSSFPVISLVFIYGGVTMNNVVVLLMCYITTALLTGSLGILCSTLFRRSTFATVAAYSLLILLLGGTYAVNRFAVYIAGMNIDSYVQNIGSVANQANSGGFLYLLLLNPGMTFYTMVDGMMSTNSTVSHITRMFGYRNGNFITDHWLILSMAAQLAAAALCFWLAVRRLQPGKTAWTGKRKKQETKAAESGNDNREEPIC